MATWHVTDNRLTHDDLPEPLTGNYIQAPYPPFWWYVNNNELVNSSLPDLLSMGAFLNCKNLTTVEIPSSVKKIGECAFYNTNIKEITIASDCEYFNNSFPPDCIIKFY